jgi:lysozyme
MKASDKIKTFIKKYETLHDGDLTQIGLQPKLDGAGIWTEGWGHPMRKGGKYMRLEDYPSLSSVMPYRKIKTLEDADRYFDKDLSKTEKLVNIYLKIKVKQHQFDALVSHAYNCGISKTLYRLVNKEAPEEEIKKWITTRYVTSSGIYFKGLQYRRNDEWEIFAGINYDREYKLSV